MIKRYTIEFLFLLAGVLFFSKTFFKDISYSLYDEGYFLKTEVNTINSKRDFCSGLSPKIINNIKIPVLNLIANESDLFDFKNGIYTLGYDWHNNKSFKNEPWWKQKANYKRKNYQSEVLGEFGFLNEKKINVIFKINGNNTRAYPQKSFRIKDNGIVQNELFKEKTSDWIILRNSGNDWDRTMFADSYCSNIMSNLNVLTSKSQPIFLYLNDSFWGLYNSRQRIDENFIASKLLVDKSKILLFENNGVVKSGGKKAEKELRKLVRVVDEKNIDLLIRSIDVGNFIDYFFVETFFNNTDWPNNNVLFYKVDSENEKWNFIPKDLDYGMNYTSDSAHVNNTFKYAIKKKNSLLIKLFNVLIFDKEFKSRFINKIEELVISDFSKENLLNSFSEYEEEYEPYMLVQINRWRYPRTSIEWQEYVSSNLNFLKNREEYYLSHLRSL